MQNFRLIFHIVYLFYMVVACIIMYCQDYQEIKGFYCLGGRPVSMQNFRLIIHIVYLFYMVVACIIMYCQDYQEIKGFYCLGGRPVSMQNFRLIIHIVYLKTMHYPGRNPVYLSLLVLRLVSFASS